MCVDVASHYNEQGTVPACNRQAFKIKVSPSQLQTMLHLCHAESLNIDVHLYLENLYESSRVTCLADSGGAPWWWGQRQQRGPQIHRWKLVAPHPTHMVTVRDSFVGSISETTMTVRVREPKRPVSSFVRPLSLKQAFRSSRFAWEL